MPENPFHPYTKIEESSPKANEKLVAELLSGEDAAAYAALGSKNSVEEDDKADLVLSREEKLKIEIGIITEEIIDLLKESGTHATLDTSFEGGVVSIDVTPELQGQFTNWELAKAAFEAADNGSPSRIYNHFEIIPWKPPTNTHFDILVLNHGKTITKERNTLVSHMETLGYRPLTVAELMLVGIARPDLIKRKEVLNSYEKHRVDDMLVSPYLHWDGLRNLSVSGQFAPDWSEIHRFLFVRK